MTTSLTQDQVYKEDGGKTKIIKKKTLTTCVDVKLNESQSEKIVLQDVQAYVFLYFMINIYIIYFILLSIPFTVLLILLDRICHEGHLCGGKCNC